MRTSEPASFWRENVIAVVIVLLRVKRRSRSDENKLSNVRSFNILRSGDCLTSFNKNNRANFSGEENLKMRPSGCPFFKNTGKLIQQ